MAKTTLSIALYFLLFSSSLFPSAVCLRRNPSRLAISGEEREGWLRHRQMQQSVVDGSDLTVTGSLRLPGGAKKGRSTRRQRLHCRRSPSRIAISDSAAVREGWMRHRQMKESAVDGSDLTFTGSLRLPREAKKRLHLRRSPSRIVISDSAGVREGWLHHRQMQESAVEKERSTKQRFLRPFGY